jgi:hypothetical protein
MMLKDRLYNNFPCEQSNQTKKLINGKVRDVTDGIRKEQEAYNPRPVMKVPVADKPTSGETLYKMRVTQPNAS